MVYKIGGIFAGTGSNVSEAARRLNEKFGSSDLPANLLRQISGGTIPFWKVIRSDYYYAIGKEIQHPSTTPVMAAAFYFVYLQEHSYIDKSIRTLIYCFHNI